MTDAAPLEITPQINDLIAGGIDSGNVLLLAAVSADGKPILSYRGSVAVFGDTSLSAWARNNGGGTVEAIKQNPNVALMYRSHEVPMLQFVGRARIAVSDEERNRAFELSHEKEQQADPDRNGTAIIIDLDVISGVLGFNEQGPVFTYMVRS